LKLVSSYGGGISCSHGEQNLASCSSKQKQKFNWLQMGVSYQEEVRRFHW
jgi:hypothetical protein